MEVGGAASFKDARAAPKIQPNTAYDMEVDFDVRLKAARQVLFLVALPDLNNIAFDTEEEGDARQRDVKAVRKARISANNTEEDGGVLQQVAKLARLDPLSFASDMVAEGDARQMGAKAAQLARLGCALGTGVGSVVRPMAAKAVHKARPSTVFVTAGAGVARQKAARAARLACRSPARGTAAGGDARWRVASSARSDCPCTALGMGEVGKGAEKMGASLVSRAQRRPASSTEGRVNKQLQIN